MKSMSAAFGGSGQHVAQGSGSCSLGELPSFGHIFAERTVRVAIWSCFLFVKVNLLILPGLNASGLIGFCPSTTKLYLSWMLSLIASIASFHACFLRRYRQISSSPGPGR